ncbi:AAA family ATPase [Vibrio ulleungensis]|uniref:AAA family ATPase n=1 Tax=Vibrio ulleungensis TaxID=2807619 RepID=A0ABS2HPJ0_9VIBR|nr:AAA family ATPase [Vibrio ulleungensis]MBM7037801.1 AAA family ATPase [Vibrio ulleungensis]
MNTLELESQTQLLDRLRLVTRFGSNFVSMIGVEGSGKTWLAQRYLEVWAAEKNQSLLLCHNSQTDAEHRSIILSQLFRQVRFDPSRPLLDAFLAQLEDEKCDIVIVVDNAEHLSRNVIYELNSLVSQANIEAKWMINVVLFTKSHTLPKVVSELTSTSNFTPLEMEIDALSEPEKERFLEFLVYKTILDEDILKAAQRASWNTPPRPGALMALMDSKKKKQVIIRSIIASPINIAAIIALIIILLFGGYYWLTHQSTPEEYALALDEEARNMERGGSTLDDYDDRSNRSASDAGFDVVEDNTLLPPPMSDVTVTVDENLDDRTRVIVPDTVVDALIEEQPNPDTTVIDDAIADATEQATDSNDVEETVVSEAPPEPVVETVEKEQQQEQQAPSVVITFSYARDELKAVPKNHYTLQLGAMSSLEDVQEFINEHELDGQVRIYPTVRGEKQYFMITYKDFQTIQAARDSVSELPVEVQAVGPWAKSMLQVHKEIDAENNSEN